MRGKQGLGPQPKVDRNILKEPIIEENSSLGYFGFELDSEAPIVVCDCISFLRHRGLQEVGIFRIPGNNDIIVTMKEGYNKNFFDQKSKFSSETSILNRISPPPDVSDVASLLKAFFKDLEKPLISAQITNELFSIIASKDVQVLTDADVARGFSRILETMPKPNYQCLSYLVSFLREVAVFQKYNNMGPDNLATCFVLSLFGSNSDMNQMKIMGVGAIIIRYFIELPVKLSMPELRIVQNNTKFSNMNFEKKLKIYHLKRIKQIDFNNAKKKGASIGTSRGNAKLTTIKERKVPGRKKEDVIYKKNGTRMVKRPILLADVVTTTNQSAERVFDISKYEKAGQEKELFENVPPPPYDPDTMV